MTLKSLFLLRPDVVFLNHGSFGASPRPVFEAYQRWQRELEAQPVEFLGRRFDGLMRQARESLSAYLHTAADRLVFVTNATTGVNLVANSLPLAAGDEVLSTDHEYGACDRAWRFHCRRRGATYVNAGIPVPVDSAEQIVERVWSRVTDRTRVLYVSHITSPTGLLFPVRELCRRARESGILSVVDGAHAPGQIPVDLESIGADFYSGNCHKWMLAPKGAGFLYARPEVQPLLDPLVVSWGWESETPGPSPFIDHHEWQGTRDISAFLSVAAAIEFMRANDWVRVIAACHALATEARRRIAALTGLPPLSPEAPEWYAQMVALPLPPCDPETLKRRLYNEYRVEVPIVVWNSQPLIRVSIQAYNTAEDVERLVRALGELLTDERRPKTGDPGPTMDEGRPTGDQQPATR